MSGESEEYTGVRVNGVAYHVSHLPGRKRLCLYRDDGKEITIAAFFKDAERALAFRAWLVQFGRKAAYDE